MSDFETRFANAMMRSLPKPRAVLARGEGAHVWDVDGKRYLDFLAGIAVNSLGHAHPVFVDAISRQASTLAHISNYFASEPEVELAERLERLSAGSQSGGSRTFFCNSGTEALEAAFKLARLTGRLRVLTLTGSFHGRTMGALALTGQPSIQDPFRPLVPGVEHIDATVDALSAAMDDDVAAVILEPIKGEAGVVEHPPGFIEAARHLTERHGALLILDEVQTGAGRTGDWFAFQHHGIVPDAIALAKGIGGGFPIGALVTFGAASDLLGPGHHGSTFGGNPLATTVSNAVLGEIERAGLVENARLRGEQLKQFIAGFGSGLVHDVQGRGLLIGIGLTKPLAHEVADAALDHGLIVNAANDDRIRLAPPLIVGDAELAEFAEKFAASLQQIEQEHA